MGFVGALFCSLVLGYMAVLLGVVQSPLIALSTCLAGGVLGAASDSLVGAAVQRKGYCPICMKPTEGLKHCGEKTVPTSGTRFVENNFVNVLATAAGATSSALVYVGLSSIF